jgi:Flp pilus assembly protein TadG
VVILRRPRRVLDQRGNALVEFGLILPVLSLMVVGGMRFGLFVNNSVMLNGAVGAGVRQFTLARTYSDPCAVAVTRVRNAAPTLTMAITLTFATTSGTVTNTTGTCATASPMVQGGDAKVSVTYNCTLRVMGTNFPCNTTMQATGRIE